MGAFAGLIGRHNLRRPGSAGGPPALLLVALWAWILARSAGAGEPPALPARRNGSTWAESALNDPIRKKGISAADRLRKTAPRTVFASRSHHAGHRVGAPLPVVRHLGRQFP